jgi:subtilisin family serine protease
MDESVDVKQAAREFGLDSSVEYAEPNYLFESFNTPNDPMFDSQWAHQKIQSERAWDYETGSESVVVAIVDSGVDWQHPDLIANIWENEDEVPGNNRDDDNNGFRDDVKGWDFVETANPGCVDADCRDEDNNPMDDYGHGTQCAGIAGAVTNNARGVAGVCWNCKVMAVRAGWKNQQGKSSLESDDTSAGIVYAANNGADVISMSWGSPLPCWTISNAVDHAFDKGVVLVAAAGNSDSQLESYPAAYDNVISVAATDRNDEKTSFSNHGDWIDVAAPGVVVLTTQPENDYSLPSGTSMSCPQVAGVAALLKSYESSLSNTEVKSLIKENADALDTEFDLGGGRLNAFQSLKALTSEPSLSLKEYRIIDESGEGMLAPGETAELVVTIKNNGAKSRNTQIFIQTQDSYIQIQRDSSSLGDIPPGGEASNQDNPFKFKVSSSCPWWHTFGFSVKMKSGDYEKTEAIPLVVKKSLFFQPDQEKQESLTPRQGLLKIVFSRFFNRLF